MIKNYTPVESFYRVAKTVAGDPAFDKKKALKKIRHYVESHDKAIRRKAEIIVDHFHEQVIAKCKIAGQARAMIVCNDIARVCDYFKAVNDYLGKIKSLYKAIVAFSGEQEIAAKKMTEADFNGFPSSHIPAKLKTDPYRFLVVANKFITGFDAIADFFAASPRQPVFYTDIEQTAAAIDEVITVLNILSTDDIALAKRSYYRLNEESGDFIDVSVSELKSGLAGINTPGILSHSADQLAKSTLVGWRYCEPKQ